MTVEKLRDLEKVIKPILEEKPQTRDDDYLLYAEIIAKYVPKALEYPARTFLMYHNELKIPNIKSVERARRKVQERYPELASERAKRKRAIEQQTYVEYGRG
jgi:hypothetical protein